MSRINLEADSLLYPMPVLIIGTFDENGIPCAMNAAWGMISDFKEVSISLGEHKTTDNLKKNPDFTVSLGTEDTVKACDYVGIVSGRDVPDKFEKAGFHAEKSEKVNAPLIKELPFALECRMKSFENGILVGEILGLSADESILKDGKIDLSAMRPIAYDPFGNTYTGLGETVGHAFHDGTELGA